MRLTRREVLGSMATVPVFATGCARQPMLPSYTDKFEEAFQPGFTWPFRLLSDDQLSPVPFRIIDGGEVLLPSGAIVACDPFVSDDRPAFVQNVPKGRVRVRFSYPMVHGEHGGRVAFARADFSQTTVARWEMALIPGQDISTLKKDEIFGYPVDAGTGCFADAEAFAALREKSAAEPNLTEAWIGEGEEAAKPLGMTFYLNKSLGPANIIMFTSGWGDGFYASYFGFDAAGAVAALLTDFAVIDWSEGG